VHKFFIYYRKIQLKFTIKQGWAKLAPKMKLAPNVQLLLSEIFTWGFLHLVDIDQT
jgi:hypothetical protein